MHVVPQGRLEEVLVRGNGRRDDAREVKALAPGLLFLLEALPRVPATPVFHRVEQGNQCGQARQHQKPAAQQPGQQPPGGRYPGQDERGEAHHKTEGAGRQDDRERHTRGRVAPVGQNQSRCEQA